MQLLKSPSIISAAVAALALGGCATSPQQVQDPSPEYRAGCDSAFADAEGTPVLGPVAQRVSGLPWAHRAPYSQGLRLLRAL